MEYETYLTQFQTDYPILADEIGDSDSIKNILHWIKQRRLPEGSVDIVGLDEFNYDFLIHLPEGPWLVFGVD